MATGSKFGGTPRPLSRGNSKTSPACLLQVGLRSNGKSAIPKRAFNCQRLKLTVDKHEHVQCRGLSAQSCNWEQIPRHSSYQEQP